MTQVHQFMQVTDVAFDQWIVFHLAAFQSQGINQTDLNNYKVILESFHDQVVFANSSICDKYAWALGLTTLELVTSVVSGTVASVVKNINTAKYFDGSKPLNSIDFTSNAVAAANLERGLVSFFGSALGCTDGTISPYVGEPLFNVHRNMGISDIEFNSFNSQLVNVLAVAGVSAADQAAVAAVLASTRSDIVIPLPIQDDFRPNLLSGGDLAAIVVMTVFGAVGLSAVVAGFTYIMTKK